MTTENEFDKFECRYRYYGTVGQIAKYAAIVLVSAFVGGFILANDMMKAQCESQAMRQGSSIESCKFVELEKNQDIPSRFGYLF